jgi:hypothetical protein
MSAVSAVKAIGSIGMTVALAIAPVRLNAQGPWSIEIASHYRRFSGDPDLKSGPGLGFEGQLRLDRGSWSSGIGVDYQRHETMFATYLGPAINSVVGPEPANFLGAFFEIRRHAGLPASRWNPYLLGRVGFGRAAPEAELGSDRVEVPITALTANAGPGLALKVNRVLSIDGAVTAGMAKWKGQDQRNGLLVVSADAETTATLTARLGVSFAIGR